MFCHVALEGCTAQRPPVPYLPQPLYKEFGWLSRTPHNCGARLIGDEKIRAQAFILFPKCCSNTTRPP